MNYHLTNAQAYLLAILVIWDLVWKGLGLWRAGRRNQPVWFVLILILNTVGLVPIIYLLLTNPSRADTSEKS